VQGLRVASWAAAASIRLLAYGSQSLPPANKRMEPCSVLSPSGLPAGGSSAALLGGLKMRKSKT